MPRPYILCVFIGLAYFLLPTCLVIERSDYGVGEHEPKGPVA